MLKLGDFSHLPQLDALVERLVADGSGLIVVAGLDLPPTTTLTADDGFLPSGRSAIFGIVMRELLTAHPAAQAVVVTEDKATVRVPRQLRRRVKLSLVEPPLIYADWIADAVRRQPELLVIDRLCAETAPAALEAAQKGLWVLSQFNTVFRGASVARHLFDLGVERGQLDSLSWILTVQRMATLCPHCKQPVTPDPAQLDELRRRYPDFDIAETYLQANGCSRCRQTGRHGNMAVFDVFRADADGPHLFEQPSLLSLEEYMLHLAALGHLSLDDLLQLEANQFRHTYNLLTASENALADANAALARKRAELEAANRVLQQRTEALISLQGIGQALTTSTDLEHLATRVCRRARDMCGADRSILYLLRSTDEAEVLAVGGWNTALIRQQVNAALVGGADAGTEPKTFTGSPPGVPSPLPDDDDVTLRAGLYVPLVAQRERVGTMIVHSTKKSRFTPGEAALLQALANQAALAIQRAGLIEEFVKKERMEQELELARQVQQSVLPRNFPQVPGFAFAAQNEPARRVGGDFYDVIALDENHFGLVIADVSDKGMPAALYMALTRSLLLAESRRERSPCAVLANVNRLLLELGEPSMFVSVFYGVVERTTRQLTYTRAGHDRPLLLRKGTIQPLGGKGAVLGFLDQDNLHLSEEKIVLIPGDRLVLYTDGLIDVLAPDGQLFNRGQLESLLQSHASLPPAEMCTATFANLLTYRGTAKQYDDMTMLAVEVK